jgi:hypothetical protein
MSQRKRLILVVGLVLAGLGLIGFLIIMFAQNQPSQPSDTSTEIETVPQPQQDFQLELPVATVNNFSQFEHNLSDSRVGLIEEYLYNMINQNSADKDLAVSDAIIRDGTYQQTLSDPAKQIYFTTFIVDIPSRAQSYRVSDYYSPLPSRVTGLYDYATNISCLAEPDLIYGPFDCQEDDE